MAAHTEVKSVIRAVVWEET